MLYTIIKQGLLTNQSAQSPIYIIHYIHWINRCPLKCLENNLCYLADIALQTG